MTELHAKVDVLEGELNQGLVGGGAGLDKRAFAVLTLTRDDGTAEVDPLASPFEIVTSALTQHSLDAPSARFALETAVLDWLGRNRGVPVHQVLGGDADRDPIPIADLMMAADPSAWPEAADRLVADGTTHLKLKVGTDFARELRAIEAIRAVHPTLPLRLDGNGKLDCEDVLTHAATLESIGLELFEEPVDREAWSRVIDLPLPWALDESLLQEDVARRLLESERVRAVVLKPTLLGGFGACFEWAERAADAAADFLVSHTFDGPIARAATAELALALQCRLAAGLGSHPALDLWPPHDIAAIDGRRIVPHEAPGLGLGFEDPPDA